MKLSLYITEAVRHSSEISSLIKKAGKKAGHFFPLERIDVVIVSGEASLPVGGNSFYNSTITLIVNQKHTWKKIRENIQPAFYHELHHLARIKTVGYGKTLQEAVITEGLAVKMEEEMGGNISPWKNFTNKKEFHFVYNTFKKERKNRKHDHGKWFFGEDFPKRAGYKLGYIFISAYCKKTNKKAYELFDIPAAKVLKLVDVSPDKP